MVATLRPREWREAGSWLRAQRQANEITMSELAEQIGAPSAAWIEAIEAGECAVPSRFYRGYARSFGMDVSAFAADCIGRYDPDAYEALFGRRSTGLRRAA